MTYIVQSNDEMIAQYERSYRHAKGLLKKLGDEYHILAVKGQEYGEGFHQYKLTYNKKTDTFKRQKL